MSSATRQAVVVSKTAQDPNTMSETVAFFNANGTALDVTPQTGANLPFAPVTTATAIGTAAKTTASPEPAVNTLVVVKFTNGNTAASPTLAFNGGAARAIQLGGVATAAIEITIAANGVAMFWFDGTILHQLGVQS